MDTDTTTELVQDQTTNNLHYRGEDKADGTPTALCDKRYRVFTYGSAAQENLRAEWASFNRCARCEAKAAR